MADLSSAAEVLARIRAGTEELIPSAVVDRLLAGDAPLSAPIYVRDLVAMRVNLGFDRLGALHGAVPDVCVRKTIARSVEEAARPQPPQSRWPGCIASGLMAEASSAGLYRSPQLTFV